MMAQNHSKNIKKLTKGDPDLEFKATLGTTSKSEWTLNNVKMVKFISTPIWATKFFLEVSALLDVRHCNKLQSCAISRKTNDATLRKWQKP